MRTPTWESSAGAGAAFLASITGKGAASSGALRDLYTITLRGGTVVRWTSHTSSITIGDRTFTSRSADATVPAITRRGSRTVAGFGEIGALEITLQCNASTTWSGSPLPLAVMNGLFFGAQLTLERLALTSAMVPVAAYAIFAGYIEAQPTSTSVTLSVESIGSRLGRVSVPRSIVQERCPNQLGDGACGINLASWTFSQIVGANTETTYITTMLALTQPAGTFDRAVVTFTTGACAGEKRMVLKHANNLLYFDRPLPVAAATGDYLTLARQCPKTPEGCDGTFTNIGRFRGCPYVPTGTEVESIG